MIRKAVFRALSVLAALTLLAPTFAAGQACWYRDSSAEWREATVIHVDHASGVGRFGSDVVEHCVTAGGFRSDATLGELGPGFGGRLCAARHVDGRDQGR